jgi:hypothetical protein
MESKSKLNRKYHLYLQELIGLFIKEYSTNDGTLFFPPVTISGVRGISGWNAKTKRCYNEYLVKLIDAGTCHSSDFSKIWYLICTPVCFK